MAEKTLLLKTCLCKHRPMYSSLYRYNNEIIRYSYPVKDFFYARRSANDPICRTKASSAKKFFTGVQRKLKRVRNSRKPLNLRAVPLL